MILAACQLVVKPLVYKSNDYASMVRDEVAHV